MIFLDESYLKNYQLGFFGLGYESRSTKLFNDMGRFCEVCHVYGYVEHTDKLFYQENKKVFLNGNSKIVEGGDSFIVDSFSLLISQFNLQPVNVFVDITVMTRHRLSGLLWALLSKLPKESCITVSYSLSSYVKPPLGTTPVRKFEQVIDPLSGGLGDLNLPSVLILGLGYEYGKALGAVNYLDPEDTFIFIPKSPEEEFENQVMIQNRDLLEQVKSQNIFYYDVADPQATYTDLKLLVNSLKVVSRPLLLPLGPKILAAIAVLVGKDEYPMLPVWRVSSNHEEEPVDRPASDIQIGFTIKL